uniref:Prokineticin 2 n=1 Tax=Nothoprocta perdicaria TaxID=30464 RepID=A0A8C6YVJ3_NOTPE
MGRHGAARDSAARDGTGRSVPGRDWESSGSPRGPSRVSDARTRGSSSVTGGGHACDRDQQCGARMCCAVSLWIRSLRMCTPMGSAGEECHPLSHRVPFPGRRMHHTCPCRPGLTCTRISSSKFKNVCINF